MSKKSAKTFVLQDPKDQASAVKISRSRDQTTIPNTVKFMWWGNSPISNFPVVRLQNLVPAIVGGKKTYGKVQQRGFALTRRPAYDILSLRVGVPYENAALRDALMPIWEKTIKSFNPVNKSMTYQQWFAPLDDGTKVFKATQALSDLQMNSYNDVVDDSDDFAFSVPDRTFNQYLQQDADVGTFWFLNLRFPSTQTSSARFFDTHNNEYTAQRTNNAYNKGGLNLTDYDAVEKLLESDFYTKKTWTIGLVVQMRGVTLRLGQKHENPCVYPIFNLSPGTVVHFQEVVLDGKEPIAPEEAHNLEQALVLEGMKGVGRKRKKIAAPVKTEKPKKSKTKKPEASVDAFVPDTQPMEDDDDDDDEDEEEVEDDSE